MPKLNQSNKNRTNGEDFCDGTHQSVFTGWHGVFACTVIMYVGGGGGAVIDARIALFS